MKPAPELPRDYDTKIRSALLVSMSGWLQTVQVAYKLHTSEAKIRPHLDRLVAEGVLISRQGRDGKEYALPAQPRK